MASDAKGTPGPWATRFLYRMIRRVRESPGDLLIASDPENDWADARLMAASPDLLAACQAVKAAMDNMCDAERDRLLNEADGLIGRAIEKATVDA